MPTIDIKKEYKKSLKKLKSIIISCENQYQLEIARNCQNQFYKTWANFVSHSDTIKIDELFTITKGMINSDVNYDNETE